MTNSAHEPTVKPSTWSYFTPRFVAGLSVLAVGIGLVVGVAISREEPTLFVAVALINVGYCLSILEERGRHGNPQ
jgi:hypothetical protein